MIFDFLLEKTIFEIKGNATNKAPLNAIDDSAIQLALAKINARTTEVMHHSSPNNHLSPKYKLA